LDSFSFIKRAVLLLSRQRRVLVPKERRFLILNGQLELGSYFPESFRLVHRETLCLAGDTVDIRFWLEHGLTEREE
jgi:hypothetical protein